MQASGKIEPYQIHVKGKGYVQGVSILHKPSRKPKCHRFGGVPYAQPAERWKRAKSLPESLVYGSKDQPADFSKLAKICPQTDLHGLNPAQMSEDCLQCDIWVPLGEPPSQGWPVWVYLHGGFLQWGSTTTYDLSSLLSETSIRAIIVLPAYRLNLFGFLASAELLADARENDRGTVGNLGFWDQRLALEWISGNIADFGGDRHNITLGGLSAGAHSTFHQLSYELRLPDSEAIIKRVVMYSNGTAFQPKTVAENQGLFDALLEALGIPLSISGPEKVSRLRSLPSKVLVSATEKMVQNQFRATTDGSFVKETLFQDLRSGRYADIMARRGIKILLGDVKDEASAYKQEYPPSSFESMNLRLGADYTSSAVDALANVYLPNKAPPKGQSWQDVFGQVYADVQVYVTQRGLISELAKHLPKDSILRYRIEWRAQCVDLLYPPEMGVTHASDMPIWFFGNGWPEGLGLEEKEKVMIQEWLGPFWRFLKGDDGDLGWGTKRLEDVRCIRSDMTIGIKRDEDWERGLENWGKLRVVEEMGSRS